jgi:hypothetical protein
MYAKVFSQILDSSIAVDYEQRHLFMDLLVLADREGVVDMTTEAISRRLNVPEPLVRSNMLKLMEPDPESRSDERDGRRLVLLDDHREWGWQIVNYAFYRDMKDADALRTANRERKRRQRERERLRLSTDVLDSRNGSRSVRDSHRGHKKSPS